MKDGFCGLWRAQKNNVLRVRLQWEEPLADAGEDGSSAVLMVMSTNTRYQRWVTGPDKSITRSRCVPGAAIWWQPVIKSKYCPSSDKEFVVRQRLPLWSLFLYNSSFLFPDVIRDVMSSLSVSGKANGFWLTRWSARAELVLVEKGFLSFQTSPLFIPPIPLMSSRQNCLLQSSSRLFDHFLSDIYLHNRHAK